MEARLIIDTLRAQATAERIGDEDRPSVTAQVMEMQADLRDQLRRELHDDQADRTIRIILDLADVPALTGLSDRQVADAAAVRPARIDTICFAIAGGQLNAPPEIADKFTAAGIRLINTAEAGWWLDTRADDVRELIAREAGLM